MERLNDETLSADEMILELKKAKAVSDVSAQIIKNAALVFNVSKSIAKGDLNTVPEQLGVETKKLS